MNLINKWRKHVYWTLVQWEPHLCPGARIITLKIPFDIYRRTDIAFPIQPMQNQDLKNGSVANANRSLSTQVDQTEIEVDNA